MSFDDYEFYDALGLAGLVRAGELKPRELLEAALGRAEQRNPAVNAIVIPMFDEARRRFSPRALSELVLTVGFYMMVCRFLENFEVDIEPPGTQY